MNAWNFQPVKVIITGLDAKKLDTSKIKLKSKELWGDMFDWWLPPMRNYPLYQYLYLFRLKEPYVGKKGESLTLIVQNRIRKHIVRYTAVGGIK